MRVLVTPGWSEAMRWLAGTSIVLAGLSIAFPASSLGATLHVPADYATIQACIGRVDMGAYEFGIGDYDCDQTVDLIDFAAWPACMNDPEPRACAAFDFNADRQVDLLDFAAFQRLTMAP